MKTPSPFFTVILILFFFIPFVLRLTVTEPFPSILFPSGHYKTDISQNSVAIIDHDFYVYRNGQEFRVERENVFGPIPEQYWTRIIDSDFGFRDINNMEDQGGIGIKLMPWKVFDQATKTELTDYLASRLNADSMRIVVRKDLIDFNTGQSIKNISTVEKSFVLND